MPSEPAVAPGSRIAEAFSSHDKRAALMPYLMGGFPSLEESRRIGLACADSGADLVELGIPFSDPLADGPVIHAAGTHALREGATPGAVLEICATLAERMPVALMVYANLLVGHDAFVDRAADAGAAALIVPDLPHDESGELRAACDAKGLALVPLVAPTTTDERMKAIGAEARGFVYTVSLTGTTGERSELPPELTRTVERARAVTELPVAVGFGISTPEQARQVGEAADGVIVGTRLVRAAGEGGAREVGKVVSSLAAALAD